MSAALKTLWHRNRWLVIAFVVALTITLAFAVRSAMFWIWWQDPTRRDQPIEEWMTPRYVAMSWQIPPDVIQDVTGTPDVPRPAHPPALFEIAERRGIPVDQLITGIEAAIAQHREGAGE